MAQFLKSSLDNIVPASTVESPGTRKSKKVNEITSNIKILREEKKELLEWKAQGQDVTAELKDCEEAIADEMKQRKDLRQVQPDTAHLNSVRRNVSDEMN